MKAYFIFLMAMGLGVLISCDRPQKELNSKINLNISGFENRSLVSNGKKSNSISSAVETNSFAGAAPVNINEVDCVAVLVSGPEDFLQRNECTMTGSTNKFKVGFFGGSFYIGSSANSTTSSVSIDVPSGNDRVLRLVGFKTDVSTAANLSAQTICQNFFIQKNLETYLSNPFLLATADRLSLRPGATQDVQMNAVFATTNQIGNCTGPDFGDGGGSGGGNGTNQNGPPAQFKISVQDEPLVNPSAPTFWDNSCVGVKFELLDSIGRPANNSSASGLTAKIKHNNSNQGFFYNPNTSSLGCDGTLLADLGWGDSQIIFPTNSNSVVVFFKPFAGATDKTFTIEDANGQLTSLSRNWNRNSGPDLSSFSFSFYDFYNNQSTVSISAANRMIIRTNECREGAITVSTVNNNRIYTQNLSPSSNWTINVSPTTLGDVVFYNNRNDCDNDSNPTGTFQQNGAAGSVNIDNFKFYYRAKVAVNNTFSITISESTMNFLGVSPTTTLFRAN